MLTRRKFLETSAKTAGAGITFLLIPIACGSGDDSIPVTSTGTTVPPCDGVGSNSSTVDDHFHTVCIPAADLAAPPAGTRTYPTNTAQGTTALPHSHTITLTQAQLTALAGGQSVEVGTSLELSHVHGFTLVRAQPTGTGSSTSSSTSSGAPMY
jgi:hypothetical protein